MTKGMIVQLIKKATGRYLTETTASLAALLIALTSVTAEGQVAAADSMPISIYPLNILEDSTSFVFYVNEEVLVKGSCNWRNDGSYSGGYALTVSGQTLETSMEIAADSTGQWTVITMHTALGEVTVIREGGKATITTSEDTKTVDLRPGTLLFENFSPVLMSQAVIAYDQDLGGKQTFPLFIIPAIVKDATLERLETAERTVMGRPQMFTTYLYGLPGVDVTIWVDEQNRICYGDVPAQHGAYVREGYEALGLKEAVDPLLSQARYEVVIDSNVKVPMRDGVYLATDVYRPDTASQFPIILVRTPYKKEMNELQGRYYARRGYVYAVQDCRGRFSSPGKWRPFFNEPQDGYDAIEWLAIQPWSNGKVGMIGGSYLGWVQWWAAREHPPHLVTIIPNVSPPDPYFNIPYEYGAFFLLGAIWWADVLEQEATADVSGKTMTEIFKKDYIRLLRDLPVVDLDTKVLGKKNPFWREWIKHPDNDRYWDQVSFLNRLADVNIPVYHQSGWFDGDGIGSKLNYLAMASHGHADQKLVLGPWGHTAQATRRGPNDTDFGPDAIIDLETSYTRWLDRWLLGIDNGIDREPLVSLFVMGTNKWIHGDKYPLPETEFTKVYLTSGGRANTSGGDGVLSFEPPTDQCAPSDTFTYDPADPTPDPNFPFDPADLMEDEAKDAPTVKSVEEEIAKRRAFYGSILERRSDLLVYQTPPLTDSLTFVGPISAVLYAASSAKDTDWFVRLSTVGPDSVVFPLVRGVIRARYRNSFSEPELMKPNEIYEYKLDLWQTGITIPAGHRLQVEVASASFPTFSRNLNTGKHNETGKKFVAARQTIFHDKDRPSHILLPVIPNPVFGEVDNKKRPMSVINTSTR